jgi:xanthine dehydrogenase molybdopterin-binding subunit B
MISKQPYQGKGQTMLDMFPTQLVAGNVANITSPTDILDITTADEVLSVDFSIDGKTKGVVLGIKTSDKIYNHTKASCDRLRGAEILNIQTIEIEGYNFLMQGIKQRNGLVEYAISFATAKNNNDANYTIQTNWYVNDYTKFNDVYNFQVWSTKPSDTQKLVADVLKNLQSFIPVNFQKRMLLKFIEKKENWWCF